MTCIEETVVIQIIPLSLVVKLTYGNIGSKGNTTYMRIKFKLSTILPNLPSKYQYFVLSYKFKKIVLFYWNQQNTIEEKYKYV